MLSASREFRRAVARSSRVLVKADVTLADGAGLSLGGDDIMMGGMGIDDATSGGGTFQVGAAVAGRLTLTLNNSDGRFDDVDFTDATVVPWVGVELDSGTEWLRRGTYGIEQPDTYGGTIGLTAVDNMRVLDEVPYSKVATGYPATLLVIVTDICTACDLTLAGDFDNSGHVVASRPDADGATCRDVLSWAAQASGNWARCDQLGQVRLAWYDTSVWEGEEDPVGTPEGDDYASVAAISSMSVFTDDVVVTGVRVREAGAASDDEGELWGTEGYVVELSDNALVGESEAAAVAALVGPRVVGMRFRPLTVQALGDPTVEAGDAVLVTDRRGLEHRSYLTRVSWRAGAHEAYACEAESPGRNRAGGYSAQTRAIVAARNAVREERTAREVAVAALAQRLADSSGLYVTGEEQEDGSTVWCAHDKPELADSQIVWRLTAEGIGISTDGGNTWPYGLDVSGNAILNMIYAIGLDAQYITTGRVGSEDGDGGYVDFDTNSFHLGKATPYGAGTLGDAIDDARLYANNYLHWDGDSGELSLGTPGDGGDFRNVLTPTSQRFVTPNNEAVAGFGLFDEVWKMFIGVATVRARLEFGNFAWITRSNGNMTLKWMEA